MISDQNTMPIAISIRIATTTIAIPAPHNNISTFSFPLYYMLFRAFEPDTK